ncbi:TraX family protein [Streptococcus anginosus]|nr:TraX family protein [Streptococcus anginosus]
MLQSLKKVSNATNLKFLAIFLMFLDHIHKMFSAFGAPIWLTMLGRIVFPLFMFLAADSFYYTHNRKDYLKRLLFMTWFMIIGNMIVSYFFTNGQVGLANNAFGAFFLAGISICTWDLMVEGVKEKKVRPFWKGLGLFLLPILLALPALFLSGYLASENISPLMVQIIAFLSWLFRTFSWLKEGISWFTLVFSFIFSTDTG